MANIFKLGTKYSAPLGATVLDEAGQERPIVMGSYGIGPARIAAAAVEQSNDERGIVWPKNIAPFDVHLVQVQTKDSVQTQVGSTASARSARGGGLGGAVGRPRAAARLQVRRRRTDRLSGAGTVGKKAADGVVEVEPRAGGGARKWLWPTAAAQVRPPSGGPAG